MDATPPPDDHQPHGDEKLREDVRTFLHQMNNQLTGVIGWLEQAQKHADSLPEPVVKALDKVHASAEGAEALVERLREALRWED